MASSEFYLSKKLIQGFGKMWFLINLQEAEGLGGGQSLLGSVVKELKSGWFGWGQHYPAPYHLTTPRLILNALEQRRNELGLSDDAALTLELPIAGAAQVVKIEKKDSFHVEFGKFPALPIGLNLGIDYNRMESITISFGDGTEIKYIPVGYMARLYKKLNGNAEDIDPNVAIDIDDNYIVNRILLATNFKVAFESTKEFDLEFQANLDQINSLPEAKGKVKLTRTSERTIEAEIANGPEYLVALAVTDWDDLN